MSDVKKRDDRPRPKLFAFIIAWTLGCFLASWPVMLLAAKLKIADNNDWPAFYLLFGLGLFATTATVQFLVILRFLKGELWGWMPLSLAGVVVGIIAAKLLPAPSTLPLSPQLLHAGFFFLLWGCRLFCSGCCCGNSSVIMGYGCWRQLLRDQSIVFCIRRRWSGGALWTLVQSLLPYPDSILWSTAGLAALFTVPTVILGLTLYVVVTQGGKSNALVRSAYSSADRNPDDSIFWLLGR